ncbi:hypothetical protein BKN14_00785 [Candidatus Gracilibacteria bacterium HOT-871]|nr:hypothetical protein BKN14_00785 [Candidatus Gracilibacteria bacterium HOT-871]
MIDFLKQIFLANFDGTGKDRKSFFFYQIVIIVSIGLIIGLIFGVYFVFDFLEINYCSNGVYCTDSELELKKYIELGNHFLFIIVLLFIFRFNSTNIQRFSFLRFSGILEKIFQIILTILKLLIAVIAIIYILNFIGYFYGKNFYYFSDIVSEAKNFLNFFPLIYSIVGAELVLFFLGMVLWRPKN